MRKLKMMRKLRDEMKKTEDRKTGKQTGKAPVVNESIVN